VQFGPVGPRRRERLSLSQAGDGTFEGSFRQAGVHDDIATTASGSCGWITTTTAGPDLSSPTILPKLSLSQQITMEPSTDVGMLSGVASAAKAWSCTWASIGATTTTAAPEFFSSPLRGAAQLSLSQHGTQGFDDVSWTSGVARPAILTLAGARPSSTWTTIPGSIILVANGHSIRRLTR